jgi:hypothetical protein
MARLFKLLSLLLLLPCICFGQTKIDLSTQSKPAVTGNGKNGQVLIGDGAGNFTPGDPTVSPNLPNVIQKTSNTSTGSVASLAKAYANNVVANNTLLVACGVGNGTAPTVTDTLSNTFKSAVQIANGTAFNVGIFYAAGTTAGADTVTCNNGGTTASIAMEIWEVNGLLQPSATYAASLLDQTSSATSGSAASSPAVSITPIIPNEFSIVVFGLGTAAQTITVAAPYNNDSGQLNPTTPAGLFSMVAASNLLTTTVSSVPTATATSEPWAVVLATFKSITFPAAPNVGCTPNKLLSANTTNGTVIKASAGQLYQLVITNTNAAQRFVKFSDSASITVGTTPVIQTYVVPGNTVGAGMAFSFPNGMNFVNGISFGITAAIADNDTTAVAANEVVVNYCYK